MISKGLLILGGELAILADSDSGHSSDNDNELAITSGTSNEDTHQTADIAAAILKNGSSVSVMKSTMSRNKLILHFLLCIQKNSYYQ